jgi:hypothetical protein
MKNHPALLLKQQYTLFTMKFSSNNLCHAPLNFIIDEKKSSTTLADATIHFIYDEKFI